MAASCAIALDDLLFDGLVVVEQPELPGIDVAVAEMKMLEVRSLQVAVNKV